MYLLHSVYSNNSSVLLDDLSRVLRILRKLAFSPGISLPVNVCIPHGVPEFDLPSPGRRWLMELTLLAILAAWIKFAAPGCNPWAFGEWTTGFGVVQLSYKNGQKCSMCYNKFHSAVPSFILDIGNLYPFFSPWSVSANFFSFLKWIIQRISFNFFSLFFSPKSLSSID